MEQDFPIREMSPEEAPQLADLLASSLLGEHSKSKTILKLLGKRNSIIWMAFLACLVYFSTGWLIWTFLIPPVIVVLGILRGLATWRSCTAPEMMKMSQIFSTCGGKSRKTWVVVCGDTVVGSVTLQRHSDTVGELTRMRVCQEYQRRGLGRRLAEHLETYCRDNGIRQIILTTSEYQESAIRLYRRCGYISNTTGNYSKALFPGVGHPAFNVSVQVYAFSKEL